VHVQLVPHAISPLPLLNLAMEDTQLKRKQAFRVQAKNVRGVLDNPDQEHLLLSWMRNYKRFYLQRLLLVTMVLQHKHDSHHYSSRPSHYSSTNISPGTRPWSPLLWYTASRHCLVRSHTHELDAALHQI
jgi:hypothetical protein